MAQDTQTTQRIISEIAARQHGIVTRAQLLGAGLTSDLVRWRVRARRLHPVYRGVYRVGPLVHPRAGVMAAVLACGPGAVISHRSAGILWQLCVAGGSEPVHITIPRGDRGRRPGIRAHRVRSLPRDEVSELDGIPITSPARTILDLAGAARSRELEQAVARVVRRSLTSSDELKELVARYPRRPGSPKVRALLEAGAGPALTRSDAEERFLALTRRAKLPDPEVNARIRRDEVDFLWRTERIVVEIDGYAFHSSRAHFESDRLRDASLAALGFHVMRVTWRQLTGEPEAVLVRLAQALALRTESE